MTQEQSSQSVIHTAPKLLHRKAEWAKRARALYPSSDLAEQVASSRIDPCSAVLAGAEKALKAATAAAADQQLVTVTASTGATTTVRMSELTRAFRLGYGRAQLAADVEIAALRGDLDAALTVIEAAIADGGVA